ncbi:hypothetical protein [Plasticicumulans sp.]|uniref:hypothetical protein n=1 Tax=Plasticicumulans sp. TaxID=2307179 RepID=UPI0039298E65
MAGPGFGGHVLYRNVVTLLNAIDLEQPAAPGSSPQVYLVRCEDGSEVLLPLWGRIDGPDRRVYLRGMAYEMPAVLPSLMALGKALRDHLALSAGFKQACEGAERAGAVVDALAAMAGSQEDWGVYRRYIGAPPALAPAGVPRLCG